MRGIVLGSLGVDLVVEDGFPVPVFDETGVEIESERLKAIGSICIVAVVVIEDAGSESKI